MAKQERTPKGKDTTVSVLQDIRELLVPVSNLARFQIQQINLEAQARENAQKAAAEPKLEIVQDKD